jgi:CubicO group peptidase (beta-lactamase class C family)
MRRLLRAIVLVLFVAATASAQGAAARFAAVRDTIAAILGSTNVASISVAVAQNDRILWEEAFGFADRENQRKATSETMYSLASISKPFTATAVMLLSDRGKIDIDKPANDYLGASKLRAHEGNVRDMTVRRILSHSAGLPLHYQFFYDGVATVHSDDVAIAKYGFAGYAPGETYFYSNLGFGILGYMAGRVGGSNYESFLRDEVLRPLGLRNTTVSTGAGLGDRAAVRYDAMAMPIAPYAFDHTGASGVWSSAHDLVRFGMFHVGADNQPPLLKPATRERMQRAEAPQQAPGSSYGLGWGTLEDDNGFRRISHTGGMPGVTTVLNLYPSERVVIVVLSNANGAPVGRVANAIAGVMLPNYLSNRRARAGGGVIGAPAGPSLTATLGGTWKGSIRIESADVPVTLTIQADSQARIRVGTFDERPLVAPRIAATGWVTGRVQVPLRAPDATPASESERVGVSLSLRVHGDRLSGWASALTPNPPVYGAVSYWMELRRQ